MSRQAAWEMARNGQASFWWGNPGPIRKSHAFYAILVEAPVNAVLRRWAERYHRELGLRGWLTPTEQMHITLVGLGGGKSEALMDIARHVGLLIQDRPLDVCLDRLSAFGGGSLVLRGSDHSPALQAFWRKLSAAIDDSPLKPFVTSALEPHVTLLRDRVGVPNVKERLVEPVCWKVRSFALIRSHQGEYECLAIWDLSGQDGDALVAM